MEYVGGQKSSGYNHKRKKIRFLRLLRLLLRFFEALDAAFKQGIVHRDIKPKNIIVDKEERCV